MIKDMDIDRSKLIAGQVAYDVDRTIAHYVLDTVIGQGHYSKCNQQSMVSEYETSTLYS